MLILDTDHLTAIDRAGDRGANLERRLRDSQDAFCTTIVSISEQLRGLLALVVSAKSDEAIIVGYDRLSTKLEKLHGLRILPWTPAAAAVFRRLRRSRIRIGTMDLRIASIALASNATLLSRNLRDFRRVTDLRVVSWLDD